MRSPSLMLVSFLFIPACMQTDRSSEAEHAIVVSEVRSMLDAYGADVKKEGLLAEFRYLEHSDDYFWVPPGFTSALTYDSTKSIIEANAKLFRSVEFIWDTLRVIPLSRELATYTGRIRSILVDTGGTMSVHHMLETGLVRRDPRGRWWILSGQSRIMNE